ncbi:pericentriolar material 1 protein isoform X1 [Simochromis diagramma]|uniref:pericentriolar material 1 protein isoform X1 n=1 Tax=Simochromis diagramma TaxID=43689 RepID=UPI001A7EF305|nr:pericentriolar material 1 protein isoform X1 [Simochromis diagramma]XP_039879703.1 pericentriolar material 1 protein isoform X1 [Simochromis diagramma]XP_039879704.1 pericentriolar material 1 protein isoform X1 [Simochromis diagramma]XP_039879705.1 pericentriolar material 1 protein isoform X1 [Simochromis diagramma]XP_039879706.1 pericentriolar material 1 protein isoform X1 [Simochromis diagramma]
MATGGTPFDDSAEELHNWTVSNCSLEDRLNNMDWGVQQKKANRSSEKNKKKLSAAVVESRLTNDISPESTPGAGRRRARTPHSFPHMKYTTQMSVPDQAELDKLRQRINFTDLDERSIGSDSQGRVTAANNQRQLAVENKKPYNFLPLHVNTNKSKELLPPSSSAPATPAITKETKKQSQGLRDTLTPVVPTKEPPRLSHGSTDRLPSSHREHGRGEPRIDSSQVVSKLVQIREYISKASSMRDDLVEKNDVPANVERLSHLIDHLKEQEKSYLRFLQKMLAQENEEDDVGTLDSAVGSGSVAESTSLNTEVRSSDASNATGGRPEAMRADQKEELENLRKQHELLKKMLEQQEQLRALQGRQEALMAMQYSAEQALAVIEDTVVTETTGSVSGLSITSELNDELNDLIQRFHNQLHDSQTKAVPDNRRQAESLSLSREVCWSRTPQPVGPPQHRPLLHSASGPHTGLDTGATAASAKLTKLQELQDKKQTMDKILQELHSLRDQTLNNNSRRGLSAQYSLSMGGSSEFPSTLTSGASASTSFHPSITQQQDSSNSADKLRKLKEVHKRLNELRELVQYYEQTSDMMVDAVNENVKDDDDEEEDEEDETEDGSMFEAMFDSEQENRQPVTNIRNPQRGGNWADLNSLTNRRSPRSGATNNRDGRLNTECEINNRSAANLRSLNIPSTIDCQYNRDIPYNLLKDEDGLDNEGGAQAVAPDSEASESSRRSSLGNEAGFGQKVHRQTAKQKLWQLQELVAMVQSDDTDGTTANEDEALRQQPNNTRASVPGTLGAGSKQSPREITLSSKAREKLYEEKLRQQKQELKMLHEERQKLIEIQGKIQDLQWACPDLQSSVSSTVSQQGLLRKVPLAVSTPAPTPAPPSSGAKTNSAVLKATAPEAATSSVTDNELWSEMRRHQILREELRQRRKHLESLMAEHQRRSGLGDSACQIEDQEGIATPSQPVSRDERTMATWGSSPCHLDDDDDDDDDDEEEYRSEMGAEEEEEQEECTDSTSDDDIHLYSPSRNLCSYSNRKNQGSNLKPPAAFSSDSGGLLHNKTKAKQQSRSLNQSGSQQGGTRRQENLRWASELSFTEGSHHWQEQVNQLQRQLDYSTSMCQTLLQDQQTLSYMLQTLLTGQYSMLPNNLSSPQVQLIMHQLHQCYTQLAWQQNNIQRLKQVLNDLLHQQQQPMPSSSSAGWQTQKQGSSQESSSGPPASPGFFLPFSSTLHPSANNMTSPFPPSFNLYPLFPGSMSDFPQGAVGQATPEHQKQQSDPNTSIKTEYMSFPPPLQRSPLNTSTERGAAGWLNTSYSNNITRHQLSNAEARESPSSSPIFANRQSRHRDFDKGSQESLSSMPEPVDPTTITKTFKTGRKASAQANLASRSKTPKSRRRRSKGQGKNSEGHESDSVGSTADSVQERADTCHQKGHNQSLLDKLTQEKLDSKAKLGSKRNDLSSAYAWRTPFLSNRIACTEAPDASSDFSLFETLRETIYSEVATLISQNESRPHFLIELFHELQLLNTDYLRQRALYSLQDIVSRHLAERSATEDQMPRLGPAVWAAGSQSELTPSESLTTSDAEVVEKNLRITQDTMKKRDDAESVDNDSTMSTSSNLEPFANDDLGNTVIHLDKALARIREYERMKLKAEFNPCSASTAGAGTSDVSNAERPSANPAEHLEGAAGGEVHCPQIDTQQLDRQIKAIMTEVIPFLKENMDEVCSVQLLTSVRRMVLTLTQQNDESKEFVRFFHRQLGGILQDSLSKFVGRTLKDCGEDLLVEISEILFNELAFFRLMQDLDNSSGTALAAKHKNKNRAEQHSKAKHSQKNNTAGGGDKSLSPAYTDEDKDQDEAEQGGASASQELYLQTQMKNSRSSEASEAEEDNEDEEGGREVPLSISLSKAETQALTNYGSGEDENEEEEIEEFEAGPVDVQTSLQASADGQAEQESTATGTAASEAEEIRTEQRSSENDDEIVRSVETVDSGVEEHERVECQSPEEESKAGASAVASERESTMYQGQDVTKEATTTSSPDTDSPVMISVDEVGSGNASQKSDEDDFVKVDDLPLQLTVMCEEELQKRIVEEQQNNNLSVEILNGNTELLTGLVGNAQALKEPETAAAQDA